MNFLDPKLDEYVIQHTSKESELLYDLHRETYLKVLQPRMLSGHFQGRVLSMISKMIRPERILELGTYTGYSALCLAEGLSKNGKLHTLIKMKNWRILFKDLLIVLLFKITFNNTLAMH